MTRQYLTLPQQMWDLVSQDLKDNILDNQSIKTIALRKPVRWSVEGYGHNKKLVNFYTTGTRTTSGYHIGLIVEKQSINGSEYYVATRIYDSGERGKSYNERLRFLKSIMQNTVKAGYITTTDLTRLT